MRSMRIDVLEEFAAVARVDWATVIREGLGLRIQESNTEKSRRFRQENPERCREYQRARRGRSGDRVREVARAYYAAHREVILAQQKLARDARREAIRAADRRSYQKYRLQRNAAKQLARHARGLLRASPVCRCCGTRGHNRRSCAAVAP